jgi:Kef-type K+ transport system membrane component KefB
MRRLSVLALLYVGMQLIQPLGARGWGAEALLAFGFLILGAYAAGELATAIRLPQLVGYIGAGVVFGPSALGTLGSSAVASLAPVSSLAIALIAFLAGAELRWDEVRERWGTVLRILSAELLVTLLALTALLVTLRDAVPFLAGGTTIEVLAFSLLFAAIAVVHSPAVTMAMLSETRARGPLARTSLGIVLFSDVVVVLLLTGVLALVRTVVPPTGANVTGTSIGKVAWEVVGAAIVGCALGALVALYLRFVRRELFLFAMIVAFFGGELARLLHVEPLLTLIVAGFMTENLSARDHGALLREAMERSAAPVFVVFFALAGAQIVLADLSILWPLVLPIVVVRIAAIWIGGRVGIRWARESGPAAVTLKRSLWTGLIPQAGVAIGLAAVVAEAYPNRGSQIRSLFLAVVAVNQVLGPILFRRALDRCGESQTADAQGASDSARMPAPERREVA